MRQIWNIHYLSLVLKEFVLLISGVAKVILVPQHQLIKGLRLNSIFLAFYASEAIRLYRIYKIRNAQDFDNRAVFSSRNGLHFLIDLFRFESFSMRMLDMKLIMLYGLILLSYSSATAQDGWIIQNPLPQGNTLTDVCVIDQNTAIVVGEDGRIIRTTDGGENWDLPISGVTNNLNSVFFANSDTGWAVGDWGIILKSTDGGITWKKTNSGTDNWLFDVFFINANVGWAVGGYSAVQ